MVKRLLPILAVLVLVLAACGDSDSDSGGGSGGDLSGGDLSGDEQEALGAIEDLAAGGGPFEAMSQDEQFCAAKAIASDSDLLREMLADTDFEELSTEQQMQAASMLVDCAPTTFSSVIAEGMPEGSGMSQEDAQCLADEIVADRDLMTGFLAVGASGEDPPEDIIFSLLSLMQECGLSLSDLGG